MCTSLGCEGAAHVNIDEKRLHTTPLAAPAAAPVPGEPAMAPPTAPAAAPPSAPSPAPLATCPALPSPGVAPALSAIASHSAMSRPAPVAPTCWYFSLPYRTGLVDAHATRPAETRTITRFLMLSPNTRAATMLQT